MSEVRKWTAGTLNAPWKDLIQLNFVGFRFSDIYWRAFRPILYGHHYFAWRMLGGLGGGGGGINKYGVCDGSTGVHFSLRRSLPLANVLNEE